MVNSYVSITDTDLRMSPVFPTLKNQQFIHRPAYKLFIVLFSNKKELSSFSKNYTTTTSILLSNIHKTSSSFRITSGYHNFTAIEPATNRKKTHELYNQLSRIQRFFQQYLNYPDEVILFLP